MSSIALQMPTNKQRITLNIPPEIFEALEACASRSNRTLANQATLALEEFLLKTGDLTAPVKLALQGRPRKGAKKAIEIIEPSTSPINDADTSDLN